MRDLQKDLEICNKATPGPWGETPSEGDCSGWHCPKNMEVCDEDCPMCEEYELYKGAWLEGPDYIEIGDYSYFTDNDARFIAQAREGWPYAIERAIKAEAEVERLKQDMRQFYFDHGLLLGENARLKRVEESAKNLLDSCLEAEAEQGDEEDYIVRLRAENAKLRKVVEAARVDRGRCNECCHHGRHCNLYKVCEALEVLDKEGGE